MDGDIMGWVEPIVKVAQVYCPECGDRLGPLYGRDMNTGELVVRERFFCSRCEKVVRVKLEAES